MKTVLSLLRGINVSGHNKIRMKDLKKLYEDLGYRDVRTYIQSGNVIFETEEEDLNSLKTRIEEAIHERFHLDVKMILKTSTEIEDILSRCPYGDKDPGRVLITFFEGPPGINPDEDLDRVRAETMSSVYRVRRYTFTAPRIRKEKTQQQFHGAKIQGIRQQLKPNRKT